MNQPYWEVDTIIKYKKTTKFMKIHAKLAHGWWKCIDLTNGDDLNISLYGLNRLYEPTDLDEATAKLIMAL